MEAPFTDADIQGRGIWQHPELEERFSRAWKDLATRLSPYKETIWGYDLLNEPLDRTQLPWPPHEWRPLAVKIIRSIRSVDPDTWIIFETGPGSLLHGFEGLVPLPDTHVIYSAHFYYPQEFTHQGIGNVQGTDLAKAMEKVNIRYPSSINGVYWDKRQLEDVLKPADEFQAKWHVPIYVGEFSVVRWAPKEYAVRWLSDVVDLFEARGWSWSYHAFREFNGWSLEHDEQFWLMGSPTEPKPATYETERAKVIKNALRKNWDGSNSNH
jgi:aryl-phospho-beta-D-glucosidase BglC (GH1 family)